MTVPANPRWATWWRTPCATRSSPADLGGAEIGVVNPGGLRNELYYAPDGTITYAEANAVLPFVNNLWTTSLTGAQFKTLLEQQWQTNADGTVPSRAYQQLGLSRNVNYTYDAARAAGDRITSIRVDGVLIDPAKSYRIGTFSFLATGGDNFRVFKDGTGTRDSGLVDRDAWIKYLQGHNPVSPDFARRTVAVTNTTAAEVKPGDAMTLTVSKLDLTSLGSPVNTSLAAAFTDAAGTVTDLGSVPVTAGAATVNLTVPAGAAAGTGHPGPHGRRVRHRGENRGSGGRRRTGPACLHGPRTAHQVVRHPGLGPLRHRLVPVPAVPARLGCRSDDASVAPALEQRCPAPTGVRSGRGDLSLFRGLFRRAAGPVPGPPLRQTSWPGRPVRSVRGGCVRCTRAGTGPRSCRMGTTWSTKMSRPEGSTGGMMLKPSAAPGLEPVLDGVGHLLRGAGEGAVPAAAAQPADELAHGQLLPPRQVHDQRVPALGALDLVLGGKVRRQLGVQLQRFRCNPQHAGELPAGVLGQDQLVQLLLQLQGFGLGGRR